MDNQEKIICSARNFSKNIEKGEQRINGLQFQDVVLCETRVWLRGNNIDSSQFSPYVQEGLVFHSSQSLESLLGISPDKCDWKNCVVTETKKSNSFEHATISQLGFYMIMLTAASQNIWVGRIQYLKARRIVPILLDITLIEKSIMSLKEIFEILTKDSPPAPLRKGVCRGCSFEIICYERSVQEMEE